MALVEMSEEALLEQMVEECGELVQAAAKRLRILRGESPTPVTLQENDEALKEEMADVRLCTSIYLEKRSLESYEYAEDVYSLLGRKKARWEERLKK